MLQKTDRSAIFWLLLSAFAYIFLAYFTDRSDFIQVLALFAIAFVAYSKLVHTDIPILKGLITAFFLRLLLLFSIPELSDDYFRFIWDGKLLVQKTNPFMFRPSYFYPDLLEKYELSKTLYEGLNSKNYFSVYPPLSQFIFWFSCLYSSSIFGSIVIMRLIILLAEAGVFLLLFKLLHKKALPEKQVYWYAFNPLVIMELSGNLHFEGIMMLFVLLSIYLLYEHRLKPAAVALAAGIGVKLLPLMFLPFLLKRLGWKHFIYFNLLLAICLAVLFFPFMSGQLFRNFFSSIDLYFQTFEFNASFYYLFRELGFWLSGYNQIAVIGPALSVGTFVLILTLAATEKYNSIGALFGSFLGAITIYLLFSTTVHPWYITTLVALATCTQFRYPMVWSALAVLSYAAYQNNVYSENTWLIIVEYAILFSWLGAEVYIYRLRIPLQNLIRKNKKKNT